MRAYHDRMTRDREPSSGENPFAHITKKFNELLEHSSGEVTGTEGDTERGDPALEKCPLCGHPMGEHTIDHTVANAVLHCPVPDAERKPSPAAHEPLGELGMPASESRLQHLRDRGEL